jgi:hypothetical protein
MLRRLCASLLPLALGMCSPDRLAGSNNGSLPPGVPDPGVTKTPAGALAAYRGAIVEFRQAFGGYTAVSGRSGANGSFIATTALLSDELQSADIGAFIGSASTSGSASVDSRTLPEYTDPSSEPDSPYRTTYSDIQIARGQAREALGLLQTYVPESTALAGQLRAVLGYAEVFEAELFCSGIPLSTVDYDGNYTLEAGSTTEQVLAHAITLFDSASSQVSDREELMNLARVGRGRALLDLGRYAEASQAVAVVPDGFQYLQTFSGAASGSREDWSNFGLTPSAVGWFASVADREGANGLDFRSSGDPRTSASATGGTNQYGVTLYFPNKYAPTGDSPIVLADWIEARLIESEAALSTGDATWLEKLNHLRESAITPALPDTTDPGTADGRVNLLFRERAFWLFLTGHREGDLRRLVRQYGRPANAVYPSGAYRGGNGAYGSDVTAPIPASERAYNPKFTGCVNRGA